jgi:hypothetical protein
MEHWGDALFKEAYSYIPQSTVAEMMNQWGFRYIYERQDLFKEVELLNTIHDSVIFQIPRAAGWHYIADVILAAKRNLEQPLTVGGMTFNVPVDTKVGYNLDEDQMLELKAKQLDGVAELALADMLQKWEETTGGTQAEAGGLD